MRVSPSVFPLLENLGLNRMDDSVTVRGSRLCSNVDQFSQKAISEMLKFCSSVLQHANPPSFADSCGVFNGGLHTLFIHGMKQHHEYISGVCVCHLERTCAAHWYM